MYIVKIKEFFLLLLVVYLSGCEEPNSDNEMSSTLSGTWYYVTESEEGQEEYYGEHIINQSGDDVRISHCRGDSTVLRMEDNKLFNENGNPYYLSVVDTETLSGFGDRGGTSVVKKVSGKTTFDDGSFTLASHIIDDFEENTNVCGTIREGRFGYCGAGEDISPNMLEIKSDYQDGFVLLSIAFKDIHIGTYDIVDFCNFVEGEIDNAYVSLESAEFESFLGEGDNLVVESGTIAIESVDEKNFKISGLLISLDGYEFQFTALVDVSDPENS
ncbi:MAG: hypothetical protein GY787_11335 [Alteromonadales bacterium]|nr:hypothetical protein [Alteromonadales bacterium]